MQNSHGGNNWGLQEASRHAVKFREHTIVGGRPACNEIQRTQQSRRPAGMHQKLHFNN